MINTRLSMLELSVIQSDRPASETLTGMVDVARRGGELGYHRVWYAEHHSSAIMSDFPPAIITAHVAAATTTIRVGSGGVLAPNHAPLSIAEQFGALAALHPGRIDMGIGRGPGTFDQDAIRALRWGAPPATDEEYATSVATILQLAAERSDVPEPWLLCSSPAGAGLAAELGLPIAVAHHIRPANTADAVATYRDRFTPSRWSDRPQVLICVNTVCADTDDAAAELARPVDIARAANLAGVLEQRLLTPEAAAAHVLSAEQQEATEAYAAFQARGSQQTVARRLADLVSAFDADELMLATSVYDPKDRIRSLELVAELTAAD